MSSRARRLTRRYPQTSMCAMAILLIGTTVVAATVSRAVWYVALGLWGVFLVVGAVRSDRRRQRAVEKLTEALKPPSEL